MAGNLKSLGRKLRAPFNRAWSLRRLREYHGQPRTLEETVDWALNFGGNGYFRVKTLQQRVEIMALTQAVAAIEPKRVIEIGTASGGTLLIWSAITEQLVVSCDLQDMLHQRQLFERFPPPVSRCRVKLLSGDSHSNECRERVAAVLEGEPADFLFIDGDHTQPGVRADFLDYRDFVRPGGLIAFHDVLENQPLATNQVYQLWRHLKEPLNGKEFVDNPEQCGFGIGVIQVPQEQRWPKIEL